MTHKKNTDLAGDLAGDIVEKNLCYCSKTDLARDIIGDLAGAKKNCTIVERQTSPETSPKML
jgi:hypothetical protein